MNNITVRNIPERIRKKLKERAAITHRSLNNEIIACLEESLFPNNAEIEKILEQTEKIRSRLKFKVKLEDLNLAKNQGRA
ncbi:MAG: Arc family DNA-binding protein [Ignavibacteria bacterium]|jgi:plasmid stability protein